LQPKKRSRCLRLKWWIKVNAHLALPAATSILTLCSTHILIGPGLNRSGDNIYHLLNEFAISHGILAGDNPLGPLGMEFGVPLLRFYQALFYLYNVGLHLITGIDLKILHNLPIVACFALSPFSYLYFLRKLGLNRWAAAIGSSVSMISIASFGNSFEAYHQSGIVTQSMGGLFFPWFMGNFIGLSRGENRASTTAVLFAISFLSHAIMSVYAVFGGALYFLVKNVDISAVWKKLGAFCVLGTCLIAFWVFPFISHTYQMRPIPDSIIRGAGVHWFTSVSRSELNMVLTTGRLLDDPPHKGDERDANDKFMDEISIIHALKTRPPMVTILTAIGVLTAFVGFRRVSRRFLLAGFFFSLMLFAGPDDFVWLRYLPFIKQIQTFRCTYLIEFFAFGLVGIGVETLLRGLFSFARTRKRFLRYPLIASYVVLVATGAGSLGTEIILLGQTHLLIRNPDTLDAMVDAASTVPSAGYPFRTAPVYEGRFKIRHSWLAYYGFQPYCTHWKCVGPTAAHYLCQALGSSSKNNDLHALAGIRYFTGHKNKIKSLAEAVDNDGDALLYRLANGPDRHGKPNEWHYVLDTGRENFMRLLVGRPLPVVCTDAEWIWLSKAWTETYRRWLWEPSTPIPMRVKSGDLEASGLQTISSAVVYLDRSGLENDLGALGRFANRGGVVISQVAIPGVRTISPDASQTVWEVLPADMKRPANAKPERDHREERDPGYERAWVKFRKRPTRTFQSFTFDVDSLEPLAAVLPMEAGPGWKASLDGKPLPAFPTGPDMLGVYLPKGAHRLDFYWQMPFNQGIMVWVSLLAVAVVLGIWLRAGIRYLK
jgi:hypothetical protein